MENDLIEFRRYKAIIDKAMAQVGDEALNHIPYPEGNSIAMILRHLGGNLHSRFTDFLTSDGEKSWRNREQEFEEGVYRREAILAQWEKGWEVLEEALKGLTEVDGKREITIRGIPLTVQAALNRSKAHIAYHAGQIVLLARMHQGKDWQWISIPKGQSEAYNKDPYLEKRPDWR